MKTAASLKSQNACGRFGCYPRYKDSGVEWLGEVPAHWEVKRLKTMLVRNDGGVWGDDFDDDGVIVLRSTEQTMDGKWRIQEPAKRSLSTSEIASAVLKEGDLVVTKSSGSSLHIGKTSIVTNDVAALHCCFSNFMQRLRAGFGVHSRFLWYVLNGEVGRKQCDYLSSTTTGLANLNGEIIGNVCAVVPPLDEQRAIAAFLDRETARIDALIEKKRRQIELLHEKRAALISHAVTKGLDPSAPMKDSGVEWLGEVPAHWEVSRLKTSGRIRYGLGEPPSLKDDGLPFIRATDIYRGTINAAAVQRVDPAGVPWSRAPQLQRRDILVVRSGAYTGDSAIIGEEWAGAIAGYDLVLTVTLAVPEFVAFVLLSKYVLQGQIYLAKMRAAQPHLNAEDLGECVVVFPPFDEQRAIAAFLDRETARIDALIEKVELSIDRLREYRTALISAAVTGKIDVREEVA